MSQELRWQTTEKPQALAYLAWRETAPRKLRLMACAFSRTCFHLVTDQTARSAIETVEMFADGQGSGDDLDRTRLALDLLNSVPMTSAASRALAVLRETAADDLSWGTHLIERILQVQRAPAARAALCQHIRDIFGNPFRPVPFLPNWRTSTTIALAERMYESRDFGLMPVLADALDDAGCDNPDVLDHCRDPDGAHVRGCWVVDLVLGKA